MPKINRRLKSIFASLFETDDGKIVIGQTPNIPILLWAIFTVISFGFASGTLHKVFDLLASASLLVWAWLEIYSGVNLFRKILGSIVGLFTLYGLYQALR